MHVTGVGYGNETGIGRLAHEGLVKRVIGGHWLWSKVMSQLAIDEKIEAYNLPQGVMALMMREIAAGRPGLLTTVGLHTFIDPRLEGGRMNKRAQEPLVELIDFHGQEMLFYKSFPIDVCIVRGTTADEDGNISVEQEGLDLHLLSAAQATYNSGGVVIAQVKRIAPRGTLNPRMVRVPAHMVTAVVVDPDQWQTVECEYNPSLCGEVRAPLDAMPSLEFGIRKFIARRAALELRPGAVVNLGIGVTDGIANIAAEEGIIDDFVFSIEMGVVGGVPAKGLIFGAAWNPDCIMSMPTQFDFYHGGGLDIGFSGNGRGRRARQRQREQARQADHRKRRLHRHLPECQDHGLLRHLHERRDRARRQGRSDLRRQGRRDQEVPQAGGAGDFQRRVRSQEGSAGALCDRAGRLQAGGRPHGAHRDRPGHRSGEGRSGPNGVQA